MKLKKLNRGFEVLALAWWLLAFGTVASVAYTVLVDRKIAMVGARSAEPSISKVQKDLQILHRESNSGKIKPREMRFKKEISFGRSKRRHFLKHRGRANSRQYRQLKERRDRVEADFRSPVR